MVKRNAISGSSKKIQSLLTFIKFICKFNDIKQYKNIMKNATDKLRENLYMEFQINNSLDRFIDFSIIKKLDNQ